MNRKEKIIREVLAQAGINIIDKNYSQTKFKPYDIRVEPCLKELFFFKVYNNPSLGLAESYFLDQAWVCDDLVELLRRIITTDLLSKLSIGMKLRLVLNSVPQLFNTWVFNKAKKSPYEIGRQHYDKGNELYRVMLGEEDMTYSCGLWKNVENLWQAHQANFDRACQDMKLKPGMKVLDIGCGNGSFLRYAAEKYGVEGVGITVSQEQAKFAQQFCQGLPVKILVCDYRQLGEEFFASFDAAASFGMFEHVTPRNYKEFYQSAAKYLKTGGIFFLHTIASFRTVIATDPFISKWIFPNSYIPTKQQALKKAFPFFNCLQIYKVEPENYFKTLVVWYKRFKDGWKDKLRSLYYDKVMQGDSFYKLWAYYLCSCQALFKAKGKYVLQLVLEKK